MADLPNVVKTVVTQTMKEQREVARDDASVAVYGLPERSRDLHDLNEYFSELNCKVDITDCRRIGYPKTAKSARLVKVTFRSVAMRDQLLSAYKALCRNYCSDVRLAPWLCQSEANKLRDLRKRCGELNAAAKTSGNDKPPYIVISGRLMKRSAHGKLLPFRESTGDSNSTTCDSARTGDVTTANNGTSSQSDNPSLSQPKNGQGGSQ